MQVVEPTGPGAAGADSSSDDGGGASVTRSEGSDSLPQSGEELESELDADAATVGELVSDSDEDVEQGGLDSGSLGYQSLIDNDAHRWAQSEHEPIATAATERRRSRSSPASECLSSTDAEQDAEHKVGRGVLSVAPFKRSNSPEQPSSKQGSSGRTNPVVAIVMAAAIVTILLGLDQSMALRKHAARMRTSSHPEHNHLTTDPAAAATVVPPHAAPVPVPSPPPPPPPPLPPPPLPPPVPPPPPHPSAPTLTPAPVVEAVASSPTVTPQAPADGEPSVPTGPTSTAEAIFLRSFPHKDSAIANCAVRPELRCTAANCVAVHKVNSFTGTKVEKCVNMCAAFGDCAYFWLDDNGGCCLKSSYDAAAALAPGGMRTNLPGDYYRLTARGPAPPPAPPPPPTPSAATAQKREMIVLPDMVEYTTTHWDKVLLIVAFNCCPCADHYRAVGTISRLAQLYGQDWKHIVFYSGTPRAIDPGGLNCTRDAVPAGHQLIEVSNRNAVGRQVNHRFLLDAFRRFPDYEGYFMIGDDVLISEGPFRQLDQQKLWLHSYPRYIWNAAEPRALGPMNEREWGPIVGAHKNMSLMHRQHIDLLMRGGMSTSVRSGPAPKKAKCPQPTNHSTTTCFDYDWWPLAGQAGDLAFVPKRYVLPFQNLVSQDHLENVYSEAMIVWALLAIAKEPVEYPRGMIVPTVQ